jgi:hypothetical protein
MIALMRRHRAHIAYAAYVLVVFLALSDSISAQSETCPFLDCDWNDCQSCGSYVEWTWFHETGDCYSCGMGICREFAYFEPCVQCHQSTVWECFGWIPK